MGVLHSFENETATTFSLKKPSIVKIFSIKKGRLSIKLLTSNLWCIVIVGFLQHALWSTCQSLCVRPCVVCFCVFA